jgi:membrane protease YdiL (CAAX protease family)
MRASRSIRVGGGWAVGLVLAVLVAARVVDRAVPGSHVAVGLGLAACLVVIARAGWFAAADLGLARSTWPAGLRWGAAAAALVGAAYALAYLIAPVREVLPDGDSDIGRAAMWAVLVVIPLGTVLPEELAFRGRLLPLLERGHGVAAATVASSGLFGLWHVVGSLGGGAANAAMADVVGADPAGMMLRVDVTVAFTALAGVVLCWLRLRAAACSLRCWPIGRSTAWVPLWPWLPSCYEVTMAAQRDDTPTGTASVVGEVRPKAEDAGARQGTSPLSAEGGRRVRYTLPGAWVGLVFACLAFTPSLLPRSALLQGVVCGISAAIGYGLGVAGAWT